MIIYAAGNVVSAEAEDVLVKGGDVSARLLTFADVDLWAAEAFAYWLGESRPPGARLFLDSGAFSVDSRGAKIDIDRYCDFIVQHKNKWEVYATLDVIGDYRGTDKNFEYMQTRGLTPLPTYHQTSPWSEMERLARDNEYIALGRLTNVSRKGQPYFQGWLDEAFRRLRQFWPVKVHLFGITAQWVLERYPAYSVDSSTAIVSAGRAGVVQRFIDGELGSMSWRDDVKLFMDGHVADSISRVSAKKGSAHMGRRLANLRAQAQVERYVNDLWISRGVNWETLKR